MQNSTHKFGSWFIDQLNVFQAANSDSASIKKNFIIRKEEFETIIDTISRKKIKDPIQHELLLGRRGSGKSTLLKRIEIELLENPKLKTKYIPVNLAEEQAGIYRLFDLWEQVLSEVGHQLNENIDHKDYDSFESSREYTEYLYHEINRLCQKHKKKVVLLLDNFDRIVENFSDDGNMLRETLINYNDVQIIGGSTRMDEHFWHYDKPFYEFFRVHSLGSLSSEEIRTLLLHWSDHLHIPELKTFISNHPGKIENVRLLTDGLPRTLQFFIQMVLQKTELKSYDYLKKIMDNVSPLFQERLNSLTAPLRKVVLEMAFTWDASSTKDLVEKTKMESKLISAHLKILVNKGIVEKINTSNKNHLYRLGERFFNLWIIITQGNPEQKRKAKWLSIYLENFYDAKDFKRICDEHLALLKSSSITWESAAFFSKGLSQSRYITTNQRDQILDLMEQLKPTTADSFILLPRKFRDIGKEILDLIKKKDYHLARQKAEEIENEKDGVKFFILGNIYFDQNNYTLAEEYYLKSVYTENKNAMFNLALLYQKRENYELAEKYYIDAIERGHKNALPGLANLYVTQEKYELAEKYYIDAIENGHLNSLNNLANILKKQKRVEEAETLYLRAIDKGDFSALYNLANLYVDQGKYEQAEKYYLNAIENGSVRALNNLANLYADQGKYEQAEKYYLNAIENGNTNALYNLANLCANQEKYEQAEKYFLSAIDKGNFSAINNLANLYVDRGKYEQAEKYYLSAIDKGNFGAINNLANLYADQGKYEQAEKYYLDAIENGAIDAIYNLAKLYADQGKHEQAEKYYLDAIENGAVHAINNLANLYADQGKHEQAEKYYLSAIDKGDFSAVNNFANLYALQKKYDQAEKYYLDAIENGELSAFYNLANLYVDLEKYDQAEKYYLDAIENGELNAINNLANLFAGQKKYEQAEKYYLDAIAKGCFGAMNNLAGLYVDQGKYEQAEKYYLDAIENGELTALYNLANLYADQEKYEQAEKYYLDAIENGEFDAINNLAILYVDHKKYEHAEKYYLDAIAKGYYSASNNLANLYVDLEKYEQAEKYYLDAITNGLTDANWNLAILYYLSNSKKDVALQIFRQDKKMLFIILAEIWNGIFDDTEKRISREFIKQNFTDLDFFITALLIHQQSNLVYKLFHHSDFGKHLQEKYMVLYYVTLLLTEKNKNNLELRIPPELNSTIAGVLEQIKAQEIHYGYKKNN